MTRSQLSTASLIFRLWNPMRKTSVQKALYDWEMCRVQKIAQLCIEPGPGLLLYCIVGLSPVPDTHYCQYLPISPVNLHYTLYQWFSTCGTRTTGGTWAPLWWYAEESPKKEEKDIYLYYTTGSSSDQAIVWNRLSSRAEMSVTAHIAVNRRFENGLITLKNISCAD